MNMHTLAIYGCAAAVIVAGVQLLAALAAKDGEQGPPPLALLRMWRRPVPRASAVLVGLMAAFGVVQTAVPQVIDSLERHPHASWWHAVTALSVQSSGWFQLAFNLLALAAVAPVAERWFGPWKTLLVFAASGVAAQAVSMSGWSPTGGGDSVAICGLLGALSVRYAIRGEAPGLRRVSLLVPAAGLVLCLLANNHGAGLLVGCALGAVLTVPSRSPLAA
ncbi:rhomboid family intramembrane serine protease [Streptomyces sp. NPDC001941]|uniref:rhomboid family intramembrane serine protease n=1 Tax=Streptomyces sp. NPDC001941 TaxID=3154659 RepID=UPI0033222238